MCILLKNFSNMWPMYVDYSDEECRRVLRSLELEAYANIVNAFRAQGSLSKERRKILQDLCSMLGISMERHRAEIRRAVNDEHLNTIAERLSGPNTSTEWAIEGRRVVPLMPRLAPQTVFTAVADSAANAQAAKNATLPLPGKTGVREIGNGLETMASRKRKELPADSTASPHKISAVDSQYFKNLCSFENINSTIPEPSQTTSGSASSESFSPPDSTSQVPTFSEQIIVKTTASVHTSCAPSVSSVKPPPKQIMLKSSSTVTTFSSFDQLNSNLLSSRPSSHSPVPTVVHEEQVSAVPEVSKITSETKNTQRLSPSICTMKTPAIMPTPTTTSTISLISAEKRKKYCTRVASLENDALLEELCADTKALSDSEATMSASDDECSGISNVHHKLESISTTSSDRITMSSSSTSSLGNKFLTQIRCKNTSHTRQNLPSSLGLKLNSQSQISQKGLSPKSSPSMKVKQDNPSNFFTKKISQTVFSSSPSTDSSNQFSLSSVSESSSVTKSPMTVSKSTVKTESSVVSSSQTSNKLTTVTKSSLKTCTPSSQYMARSLFSTSSKAGAKTLPPVIFNVSSSSCTPLQTSTKTTVSVPSDGTKTTPQLLPKSTSVGINPSHLKINASNAQTIQYRNDGGVMRSARIVNITQPVGSRLPCAITPSAISALGLASNLTSTALRVTLPAGTLNTSASMRVSAAAKPNVIVVHKAQMWPRTQQGAAVIMSSGASLPKISNDVNDSISLAQKQEKSRLSGAKLAPRPIAPAQTTIPAVTAATVKIPDTSLLINPLVNKSQSDSSGASDNSSIKSQENLSENQCKKNLLADVIEASGILDSCSEKTSASVKDKGRETKEERRQSSLFETDAKNVKKSTVASSATDVTPTLSELNASKSETAKFHSENESVRTTSESGKNALTTKSSELPVEQKEISEPLVSSSQVNESISSSAENNSSMQNESSKEKTV